MNVRIKEREYEYISDYPQGWNLTARNHFKCPVEIGPHKCFIKRFERKSTDDISGWQLLQNLKGKNEQNLPRLYDIERVKENGRDVDYVFFDYLQGNTLYKLLENNTPLNLGKLTEDLFRGLQSVHIRNYWFTDFGEKNIFCEKDGRFLLVDLDNTQPTSELPDKDLIGNNRYWLLVFNFYKEILHQRNLNPDDINGSSINYLQAGFLILKIKLLSGGNNEHNRAGLFKRLPAILDECSPAFKEIYSKVFRNSELALQSREIEQIKILTLNITQQSLPSDGTNVV